MISKIDILPKADNPSAEMIKMQNLFAAYPGEAQLFRQSNSGTLILLLNKDAIVCGENADDEVKNFLAFLRPDTVFSSSDNLKKLFDDFEAVNVLILEKPANTKIGSFENNLSSREIYDILCVDEFDLPPYEYFATDYCYRLNHGLIRVFSKRDVCAAITLESENYRLLSGIVTKKKGLGGALLLAAVSGEKPVITVCRDKLVPFYIKYGFKPLYKAGYWRKHS